MCNRPDPVSRAGPPPPRPVAGTAGLWTVLAGSTLLLMLGCHSLTMLSRDKPAVRTDTPATPAADAEPSKYSVRIAPFVFLSDFDLKLEQPLLKELGQLGDQVYRELRLPPGSADVSVYLFENEDRYRRFMEKRHPELPHRHAFFLAQERGSGGEDLLVYTYRSERLRQDLRHELTHALLHRVIYRVPLWLDEGLAEYFELPPESKGVNAAHVEQLRRAMAAGTRPDLSLLEALRDEDVGKMSRADYQEAWAWVHLMLNSRPEAKSALIAYLQQLRANGKHRAPAPLRPQLARVFSSPETGLEKHLAEIDVPVRKGPMTRKD